MPNRTDRKKAARPQSAVPAAVAVATPPPAPPPAKEVSLEIPLALLFFAFFFLYIWGRIEPAGEYYLNGSVFRSGALFFGRFVNHPGRLVDYAARYLEQLNYFNWLGALVFTAIGASLYLATILLCRMVSGRAPLVVCLAPPFVLLVWRDRYAEHSIEAGLALLLALGTALALRAAQRLPIWFRLPVSWAIAIAVFYLAGPWSLALFVFLAAWSEAVQKRKWPSVAALAVPGLLIPFVWHGLQLPHPDFNPWGTGLPLLFALLLFLTLPAALIVLKYLPSPNSSALSDAQQPRHSPLVRQGIAVGSFVTAWVVVWFLMDGTQNSLARIEYYAANKQDEKLLAVASRLKTLRPDAEVRTHLALYHEGRLTQDLFAYPVSSAATFLPGLSEGVGAARAEMDTMYELGQINEAERMAQEALEFEGDLPDVLRMLARINVIKDRPKAAAVFLNVLREEPFQSEWADVRLSELEKDPQWTCDPELTQLRSFLPTTDFPHGAMSDAVVDLMSQLLASNPRNKMAFEYLMTEYLLAGNLKRIAQHAGQLEDFKYPAIPRAIEEALVLGESIKGLTIPLRSLTIRPATRQRYQDFCVARARSESHSWEAMSALNSGFGDTFWYYYYVRLSSRPK